MNHTTTANFAQLEAIETTEGPLLIIAGPGSGKTFTLVERIVHLITEKNVTPESLFVVTFTEKAAHELTTRISNRLNEIKVRFNLNEMYLGTFHSICLRWLDEHREFTRLKRNFSMMDEFDQKFFIYQRMSEYEEIPHISLVVGKPEQSRWAKTGNLVKWINTVSEEALDPQKLIDGKDPAVQVLGKCAELYQRQLEEANALDFSTIQYEALTTVHQIFADRKVKKFGDELRTESLAKGIPIVTSAAKLSREPVETLIGLTFMSALHHLMISDQKMISPHVVILDEAGQLPVAQGLSTGLSGAGSILLFGDDKQMPPVFGGDLSEEPLATSVFAQLRSSQPQAIQMLNTTYRLNQDLSQAIGTVFYAESAGDPLHPSERAADRHFPEKIAEEAHEENIRRALSPSTSLVWLQVATRNCMQINHEEAQAAARLVATCLNSGMTSSEIAVVTPFRRQAAHIRQLIAAQVGDGQELPIVDTVERVQGLTVEAVIVSFCASERDYIASIADFLFSPNRLNVAVSRARTKAIIISSPEVFNCLPKSFRGVVFKNLCDQFLRSVDKD